MARAWLRCCRSVGSAALLAVLAAGCRDASTASVSGMVTYDESPVARGQIMFTPADGKGPIVGGSISGGTYRVGDILPGQKIVQISSIEDATVVLSTEDLAKAAQTGRPAAPPPIVLVAPNAVGNGATIEIKSGQQTHNFSLKKPAGG